MAFLKLKNWKNKIKENISELFSFEKGVDITNDTDVLYRKNKVIKNFDKICTSF